MQLSKHDETENKGNPSLPMETRPSCNCWHLKDWVAKGKLASNET